MKSFSIIFICLILFSSSHGSGQNSITLSTHYGIYLTNSENSTPIIGEQSLRGFMGGTVGYTHPFSKNFALGIDLGYCTSTVNNIQQFVLTGVNTPNPIGFFYAHMSYKQFFSDVSLRYAITDLLSVGGGPSFSIIHHTIYTDPVFVFNLLPLSLDDRLASAGLGANSFAEVNVPLGSSHIMIGGGIKFRYIYSVWFDKGGRNLDNYSQSFLSGNLYISAGYNF